MNPRNPNNNNNNRQANNLRPFQIQRELFTMTIQQQSRNQFLSSRRNIQQNQVNQIQQVQARAPRAAPHPPIPHPPTPHPPNFQVFAITNQVQSSSVPQTPNRSELEIMRQSSSSHPSSLTKNTDEPIKVQVDEQFESVSVIQYQQGQVQQDMDQDQNMMEHNSQQFEKQEIRQDEMGQHNTPLEENNHQINGPSQQQQDVQDLNSQSQVQIISQNVSPVQQIQQPWLNNENGENIIIESQMIDPNVVISQQPPVLQDNSQDQSMLTNSQSSQSIPQETPRHIENQFQSQPQQLSGFQSDQQKSQGFRSLQKTPQVQQDQENRRKSQSEKKTPPPNHQNFKSQSNQEQVQKIQIQTPQPQQGRPRKSNYYELLLNKSKIQTDQREQSSDQENNQSDQFREDSSSQSSSESSSQQSSNQQGMIGNLILRFKNLFNR